MGIVKTILSLLAALTCMACAFFLFRAYFQKRVRLLLWSAICFTGLSANNIILFVDLELFPAIDLRPVRLLASMIGMLFMLYAFIWETE